MTIAEDCIRLLRIMQKELLQSTGSLDKSKSNWEFMELLKATIKKAIGCAKYYDMEHDIDLSRSLQGLSRVHM